MAKASRVGIIALEFFACRGLVAAAITVGPTRSRTAPSQAPCADGTSGKVVGAAHACDGTWTDMNLQSDSADGASSQVCGDGWALCGRRYNLDQMRSDIDVSACHAISGVYVAAFAHAVPGFDCSQQVSDPQAFESFGTPNSGWGSEPVCCGTSCSHRPPSCPSHVFGGSNTWIQARGGIGSFPPADANGALCCAEPNDATPVDPTALTSDTINGISVSYVTSTCDSSGGKWILFGDIDDARADFVHSDFASSPTTSGIGNGNSVQVGTFSKGSAGSPGFSLDLGQLASTTSGGSFDLMIQYGDNAVYEKCISGFSMTNGQFINNGRLGKGGTGQHGMWGSTSDKIDGYYASFCAAYGGCKDQGNDYWAFTSLGSFPYLSSHVPCGWHYPQNWKNCPWGDNGRRMRYYVRHDSLTASLATTAPSSSPTSSPTSSPSPAPTQTPTASPTGSPTSSPSPAPTQDVATSAKGDPHLINMRGQHFDLYQTGVHVLIQVPWLAKPADSLLRVEAEARRLGGACADLYFEVVNITGSWTTESGHLEFFANIEFDDAYWHHFGNVDLKIVRGHTMGGIPYLNLLVKHLSRVKFPVGGLLGEDDHTAAMTPPSDCGEIVDLHRTRRASFAIVEDT